MQIAGRRSHGLIDAQQWALARLDAATRWLGRAPKIPPHLATGLRGERDALFHLRRLGYTVVARRWSSAKARGDLDLVAWEGERLCFIEVKTRTARDMTPAQSAVDEDKRDTVRRLARLYLRTLPEKERRSVPVRFDVVAVYLTGGASKFEVFRGAFGWR
jgi:putative endonuclease